MSENTPISYKFPKKEKLIRQKSIDRLFTQGESFVAYPLRVVYFLEEYEENMETYASFLISVSKRKFKRANKRNRVKRLAREAYRLNKHELIEEVKSQGKHLDIAFIYLKDTLPDYEEIEKSMHKTTTILLGKLKE